MRKYVAIAVVFTLIFFAWGGFRVVKRYQFDFECEQYIKRAGDANTVELAKDSLAKAISYAEENGLTNGIVSIMFEQPSNDVGYWYQNLKAAYEELENISEDATALEKSNVLMKLRETLLDNAESSVKVTVPEGIEIYPHNVAYCLWGTISGIGALISWCVASKQIW